MTMIKFLVFLLSMNLFACKEERGKQSSKYYVVRHVPQFNKMAIDSTEMIYVPPPPMLYYGNHNFVLLDTNRVFYHSKHSYRFCGMGIDYLKPPRLYLESNELVEVKFSELDFFLSNLISDSICDGKYVNSCISSFEDTVKNTAIKIIINCFKVKGIHSYNIRNWTEEEQYALEAKVENKPYNSREAKFKAGFDTDPIETMRLE